MSLLNNELRKQEATEYLKSLFDAQERPTMYVTVVSVARSGMSRTMKTFVVVDGDIRNVTAYVAALLDEKYRDDGTIRVTGCGMDMTAEVVREVSAQLYGRHGERTPSGFVKGGPNTIRAEYL